ncbi:hypothetical protein [Prescottella subtropica]|uniref:hypothetical protein n=1 Tax=Prescottella subtropica TaxID=2545757 RepID=UPI0010F5EE2D|nr:hypothetical protein [Prescottella subtropica]
MVRLARVVGIIAALLCGLLAGRVLWSPLPPNPGADSVLPAVLFAGGSGTAVAALLAVAVTAALTRRRSITLTTVGTVAGLLLLALPGAIDYPSESAVLLYSNAVAAGLILGAVAPPSARYASTQAGLAGGLLAAFLLTEGVEGRGVHGADFGWIAYTPLTSLSRWEPSVLVPVWLPTVAAVLVVLGALLDRRTSWTARIDSRVLVAALALPVAAFAAHWILADTGARPVAWVGYVVVAVAAVVAIAWRLPGRDGRVLFAAGAVVAASLGTATSESWVLVVSAVLLVGGLAAGLRFPVPPAGFALLAVVAAADLVAGESWTEVPAAAVTFVLPAAAGYVVGACLPTSAPASTVGLSLPFTVGVPAAATAAWVVTARYADYRPGSVFEWSGGVPPGAAVAAIAVVVVCGVGAWGLDLRSGNRESR